MSVCDAVSGSAACGILSIQPHCSRGLLFGLEGCCCVWDLGLSPVVQLSYCHCCIAVAQQLFSCTCCELFSGARKGGVERLQVVTQPMHYFAVSMPAIAMFIGVQL